MSYTHIKTEQVTGGVSSYDIDNIFSADYDIYKIFINAREVSTQNNHIKLQFRNSSGTITSANYDLASAAMHGVNTALVNERYSSQTNSRRWIYMNTSDFGAGSNTTIYNPYSTSYYTLFAMNLTSYATEEYGNLGSGALRTFDQVTGITLLAEGTLIMDDILVSIYGRK
jgi:hypothetical protein